MILACSTWVSATFEADCLCLLCLLLAQMRAGTGVKKAPGCFGVADPTRASLGKVRQAKGTWAPCSSAMSQLSPHVVFQPLGLSSCTPPAHSRMVPHSARPLQRADLWYKHNVNTAAVVYVALNHPALKSHPTYLLPQPAILGQTHRTWSGL